LSLPLRKEKRVDDKSLVNTSAQWSRERIW